MLRKTCILLLATRAAGSVPPGTTRTPRGDFWENRRMESIRVMIIDEHPLFRQGCRWALEHAGDCVVVAEASESREGLELAKQHSPDVVLIDALLSTNDALALARQLRHSSPRVAIIMLTAFEDADQLFQSMKLAASDYLLKGISPDELVGAVRQVSQGSYIINNTVLSPPPPPTRPFRT